MKPHIWAALNRFEKAVDARAFKGAQHPDDWDQIEEDYVLAKQRLVDCIDKILKSQP